MSSKKTTMTDIAKEAGVSQSTVSMILRGKNLSSFPSSTVSRVLDLSRDMNYTPPVRAKKNRIRPDAKEILVLMNRMTNPYYPAMLQSIDQEAIKHGLRVVGCNTYYSGDLEQEYLKMASDKNFVAVIFTYAPKNRDAVEKYNLLIPIISICDSTSGVSTDQVELNDILGGRLAAEYLLSLGHRNITYMTGKISRNYSREARLIGIRQAIAASHEVCDLNVLTDTSALPEESIDDSDYNSGYALAGDESIRLHKTTAIIAVNDSYGLGAIDYLTSHGSRVPEEISVLGFNNLLYAGLSKIPLTTVDNHAELVATAAIKVLLNRLNILKNNDPSISDIQIRIECRPRLIIRNSTAELNRK